MGENNVQCKIGKSIIRKLSLDPRAGQLAVDARSSWVMRGEDIKVEKGKKVKQLIRSFFSDEWKWKVYFLGGKRNNKNSVCIDIAVDVKVGWSSLDKNMSVMCVCV